MKAAFFKNYGSPDVLSVTEIEKPVPKEKELLIRVYATTVNRTDCAILRAQPFIMRLFTGLFKPRKNIPGTDFAGRIIAVGKEVSLFNAGDDVFGFDDTGLSSQAEYMTLSEDKAVMSMPVNLSFEQAAASSEGAHYAYNGIKKVSLKPGDKVLVNGATGAIGTAAVQLLHYFGADITAVCNTKNLELVTSIGANQTIDYSREDFTQSDKKYSYIFDAVGKSTFSKCKPILEPGGVYISSELGPWAQNIFLPVTTRVSGGLAGRHSGKRVIFPFPSNIKRSLLLISKMTEECKFKAVIDRSYPLEDIADAYRYVETGEKTGNVVITYG
ncbi:NAD(P)-dependent alcohol dehydrogenase [soil metagenome]